MYSYNPASASWTESVISREKQTKEWRRSRKLELIERKNPDREISMKNFLADRPNWIFAGMTTFERGGSYFAFFFSQSFIQAISVSCALMISVASFLTSGSLPYCRTTLAISTAP